MTYKTQASSIKVKIAVSLFVICVILFVSLAYFVTHDVLQVIEDRTEFLNGQKVVAELETIVSLIASAEAGDRGYALSGQKRYLQVYEKAWSELPKHMLTLQSLAPVSGDLHEKIDELAQLTWQSLRKVPPDGQARQNAQAILHKISRLVDNIERQQEERLIQNLNEAKATSNTISLSISLLVFLLVALTLCATYILWRWYKEREQLNDLSKYNAELRETYLQNIVRHSPVGIAKFDLDLTIKEANASFHGLFLISSFLERKLDALFPDIYKDIQLKVLQELTSFQTEHYIPASEIKSWCNGIWLNISAWPLLDVQGKLYGGILLTAEVSEQVKLMLEREDLFNTIVHDMKVPLIGLDRLLQLMVNGVLGELDHALKEALETALASNNSLLQLVDMLNDIQRAEHGLQVCRLERCNFSELIERCLKRYDYLPSENRAMIEKHILKDLTLVGDELGLERVVTNLIDNAVKYTPADGMITVEANQVNGSVVFKVVNTGTSIDPEIVPMLFHRFVRATRQSTGSGLGLYLCNKIVENHHGSIEVESQANKDTTFTVTLPLMGI